VIGDESRKMGWSLWRDFMDAGGPWPTEFHLKASPTGGLATLGKDSFLRQGPHCQYLWTLMEHRARPAWI